jgi:hypothetical protein
MKELRFLVLGALLLTVGRFEVSSGQVSSPYAQALARTMEANELRVLLRKQLIAESGKLLELSGELKSGLSNRPQPASGDRVYRNRHI